MRNIFETRIIHLKNYLKHDLTPQNRWLVKHTLKLNEMLLFVITSNERIAA